MVTMKYLSYSGSIEPSLEDGCLHGEILFIDDLITYEAQTVPKLEKAFRLAVDQYLVFCKKQGKEPNRPFSGSFNVRIDPLTHRQVAEEARANGVSLNQFVASALRDAVQHTQSAPQTGWHQPQAGFDATLAGNKIRTEQIVPGIGESQ